MFRIVFIDISMGVFRFGLLPQRLMVEAGVPSSTVESYAALFNDHGLTAADVANLTHERLQDIGIGNPQLHRYL